MSAFALIAWPATLYAQAVRPPSTEKVTSLEDALSFIVGTGVRGGAQVSLADAPAIIEVIDRQTIAASGARSVAQLLRDVAGIYMIDDHLFARVGVRGVFGGSETPNEMVKVMVNGQAVDVRTTSSAFLEHSLIPIDAIERIEVVRGATSAAYGANALVGVINIVTTETSDKDASRVFLSGAKGPVNGRAAEASAVVTRHYDYVSYTAAATYETADRSGLALPGENDLTRAEPEGYPSPGTYYSGRSTLAERGRSRGDISRLASFYGGATYEIDDDLFLSGQAVLQYHDSHGEFQAWSPLSHDNRFAYMNGHGRVTLERRLRYGRGWAIKGSLGLSLGRPGAKEALVDPALPFIERRRKVGYGAVELSTEATYAWSTGSAVLGIDGVVDEEQTQRIGTKSTAGVKSTLGEKHDKSFRNLGAFGQLMWRAEPWPLSLTGAVRADTNNQYACDGALWSCLGDDAEVEGGGVTQLSTRAAAVVNPSGWPVDLKLIYGSAYKPPSPYQLERQPLTTQAGAAIPTLLPQTTDTYEVFARVRPLPSVSVSATLFHNQVANALLSLTEANRQTTRNADLTSRGLESTLDFHPTQMVTLQGNLTYLFVHAVRPHKRSEETDVQWDTNPANADHKPGAFPRLMANAILTFRLPQPAVVWSMRLRYVGERHSQLGNSAVQSVQWTGYDLPSYVAIDTNFSYAIDAWSKRRPTTLSLRLSGVPGGYADAGDGGIDIPSWMPVAYVGLAQDL